MINIAMWSPTTSATNIVKDMRTIGTGISQGRATNASKILFEHDRPGVMTHFWVAGDPKCDNMVISYYIDGETEPSIRFVPSMASGVGFDDQAAPWATRWIGKGAQQTGWFHNFRIPFNTIRITYEGGEGVTDEGFVVWLIVRGLEGMSPLTVNGLELPTNARLKLMQTDTVLQPLEFVDLASSPKGTGGYFFSLTLSVASSLNFNFMEGCFHFYDDLNTKFPGTLLSTGMEDYFDSAFYFNGGDFHAPVAGSTHKQGASDKSNATQWAGYRFHEMDPIIFQDGFRFQWRNGDVTDASTGLKCTLGDGQGGKVIGNPQVSSVLAYAWVYVW